MEKSIFLWKTAETVTLKPVAARRQHIFALDFAGGEETGSRRDQCAAQVDSACVREKDKKWL